MNRFEELKEKVENAHARELRKIRLEVLGAAQKGEIDMNQRDALLERIEEGL